jgi:hypothetical protein
VRELEHHAEDQPGRQVQRQEADQELPPGDLEHEQRQGDHHEVVRCLA